MNITEIIQRIKNHEKEIKYNFKVKEIGIFGSYVRGEQTLQSDIDILVDIEIEGKTFDNYMNLKYYLENLLALKVDLIMKGAIKKRLRPSILEEVVYV